MNDLDPLPTLESRVDSNRFLTSKSFLCLLAVQFVSALNDNFFRWFVLAHSVPRYGWNVALSVVLVWFTVPYIVCSSLGGYLADRFSKGWVIRVCSVVAVPVMLLGLTAITLGQSTPLFAVIAMVGTAAAIGSPAKSGSIPELVKESLVPIANGLMGLTTIVSAVMGLILGCILANEPTDVAVPFTFGSLVPVLATILGFATLGCLVSFGIRLAPIADPGRAVPWNPFSEIAKSESKLASDQLLLRAPVGIAIFWMLAAGALMNLYPAGQADLITRSFGIAVLGVMLVFGAGAGSLLAGIASQTRLELGIVPFGAIGMALTTCVIGLAGWFEHTWPAHPFLTSSVSLASFVLLGLSAGLFVVPLHAYIQQQGEAKQLGRLLGATNFTSATLVLFAIGISQFPVRIVLPLAEVGMLALAIYAVWLLCGETILLILWIFFHTIYQIQVRGLENIPKTGPVLLTPNHVSFIDGLLVVIHLPRRSRFIVYADFVTNPYLNWLARIYDVIPIKSDGGPKSLLQSLKTARDALNDGILVCIFPEGQITRTGQIQPFAPGMMKILQGTGAPVVPVHLQGLWGSIFSYRGGKFFWKRPRRWKLPLSVSFGKPIPDPKNASTVRFAVQELGADAMDAEKKNIRMPPSQFVRNCKRKPSQLRVADSMGMELTGGKLLASALAFRRVLLRDVLGSDEPHVGILLPPTVGCAVTNLAVTLCRRVSVNLNYTMSEADINFCIRDAGVKHVLTSRKFIEKRPVKLDVPMVFLEDLKDQITGVDRLLAGLGAFVAPSFLLERLLGLNRIKPDDPITAIYTSGSTGEPKGVLLSHHNIAAEVDAANQIYPFNDDDVVLGVVPIFHSLGYVGTLWLPLILTSKVVYHVNPLDAKEIGKLSLKYGGTVLFGTPTFLRGYLKRCEKEQFAKMGLVMVGAEKLPLDLAEQFREKFGLLPTEGYGATETTGPATANIADYRDDKIHQKGTKLGTVGRPLPGVAIRAVDPETRQPVDANQEGLLLIKGPTVMLGYWNRPELTAAVIQDGWYNTGDMGLIDDDGFIQITGRLSRFSKIGGEMIPHLKLEECLNGICDDRSNNDHMVQVAVTSVPDAKKGERLIVLHKRLHKPISQIIDELSAAGIPNLSIPSMDSFIEVEEIPLLGTGKLDLRRMKQLALDRTAKA